MTGTNPTLGHYPVPFSFIDSDLSFIAEVAFVSFVFPLVDFEFAFVHEHLSTFVALEFSLFRVATPVFEQANLGFEHSATVFAFKLWKWFKICSLYCSNGL